MPVTHTIDLDQLPAFLARQVEDLEKLDYRKPLQYCAYLIANETKENFNHARAPDGTPWKPLKRPRKSGRSYPLWDTGRLVASVGAADVATQSLSKHELIFGTNVEYAGYHQYGTKHIPQREFLGINDRLADAIDEVFVKFLEASVFL